METLLQDLRYALRTLRNAPGFALIAVACLAIGIGATTLVFSAVNTLLLRPLPFAEPERVMMLYTSAHLQARPEEMSNFSYPEYLDLGDGEGAFSSVGAYTNRMINLGGIAEPQRIPASRVSASLFPTLGLRMALGRSFRPEEDEAGGAIVLSHGLWLRHFGGDPQVLGRTVTINGSPYEVIGVMEPRIRFPEIAELWLPLEPGSSREERSWRQYDVVARLAPGVTLEQARARIAAVAERMAERYPEANGGRGAWLEPYREQFSRELRPIMLIMLGAVFFVLLIACANVANLLLARASARQKEMSVRVAVGASRGRILRQLLTESLLLGLAGGVAGALLANWGLAGVVRMLPMDGLPFWMVFDIDLTVLLFTIAVAVLTAIVFGLVPALQAYDPSPVATLKEGGGRGATAGGRGGRLRSGLVVAQLALSLVLLAGATLMIRSLLRLQTADPGFHSENVLSLELSLQGARYPEEQTIAEAYRMLLADLQALPGAEAAGAVSQLPIGTCCNSSNYFPEGRDYPPSQAPAALFSVATPGFFQALGIPLLAGRHFGEVDRAGAPRAAIVNRAFAEREWPDESPVGKRLRLGPTDSTWFTVVGVVGTVKQRELAEVDRPQLYVPHAQSPWRGMAVVVRTPGDPLALVPEVRAAIRSLDPDLPLAELRSMQEVVARRMFQPRVYGVLFGIFAGAALLLATIGLYGVISYAVAKRTHEIGIRMALGALPAHVLRLVIGQGMRLVGLGLLIGVPAAFALSRLLRGALYGVSTSDPLTFAGITLLLAGVALLASYLPARRATRVDPMTALRSE